MYVVALYAVVEQILRQLFRHALGQRGDEGALVAFDAQLEPDGEKKVSNIL